MKFTSINGYMGSRMWLMATLIQVFTLRFCRSFWNHTTDPSGGMYDQMTRAARSVTANIAEGLGRHQTSRKTEMKLLDVARASLSELYNDYYFIMLDRQWPIWSRKSQPALKFDAMKVENPMYQSNDWPSESMALINDLVEKFKPWCECGHPDVSVNSIMILINRLQMMIEAKMNYVLDSFKEEGGFTESLTRERLERRNNKANDSGNPRCPKCGKPMLLRLTKAGARQGEQFWGCSDYPRCTGIRQIEK